MLDSTNTLKVTHVVEQHPRLQIHLVHTSKLLTVGGGVLVAQHVVAENGEGG